MADSHPISAVSEFQDLTGLTLDRLLVVSFAGINVAGRELWTCRCRCGIETTVPASVLVRGNYLRPCRQCVLDHEDWSSDGPIAQAVGQSALTMPSGCIEWQGARSRGYGSLRICKISLGAHVASYRAFRGPIPRGLFVCHTCDNPPCINPDHLFLGTVQDNATDMVRKGRQGYRYGEFGSNAKLNHESAARIRLLFASGQYKRAALGAMFGVTSETIRLITNNKLWT